MKVRLILAMLFLFSGCAATDTHREAELSQELEVLASSGATKADVIQFLENESLSYSFVANDRKLFASDVKVTSIIPLYKSGIFIQVEFNEDGRILNWSIRRQYGGL